MQLARKFNQDSQLSVGVGTAGEEMVPSRSASTQFAEYIPTPQPPAELEKTVQRHLAVVRVVESESSRADAPSESESTERSPEITMTEVQPSELDEHPLAPLLDSSTSTAIRPKLASDDEVGLSSVPAISHTQTLPRRETASPTFRQEPIDLETSIDRPGRRTKKVEDDCIDSDNEYCPADSDARESTGDDSSDDSSDDSGDDSSDDSSNDSSDDSSDFASDSDAEPETPQGGVSTDKSVELQEVEDDVEEIDAFRAMIDGEEQDQDLAAQVSSTERNDILFDPDEIPVADDLPVEIGVPIDDTDDLEEIAPPTPTPELEELEDDGSLDEQTKLRNRMYVSPSNELSVSGRLPRSKVSKWSIKISAPNGKTNTTPLFIVPTSCSDGNG
jgi:hypothetical protein